MQNKAINSLITLPKINHNTKMQIKSTSALELKSWLEDKKAVLIDVREPSENRVARIKEATLIPLGEVNYLLLPELEGKKLVIHCKSGKRSFAACEKLLAQNPDLEIYNLEGGIEAWQNSNLPILSGNLENEKNNSCKKCSISLERQVQIIAGSSVFIGALFGLVYSKIFLILPLFFGAGLVFAGIRGCCGLKIILAKMPFNK